MGHQDCFHLLYLLLPQWSYVIFTSLTSTVFISSLTFESFLPLSFCFSSYLFYFFFLFHLLKVPPQQYHAGGSSSSTRSLEGHIQVTSKPYHPFLFLLPHLSLHPHPPLPYPCSLTFFTLSLSSSLTPPSAHPSLLCYIRHFPSVV